MAEHGFVNTVVNTSAAVAITGATSNSSFAQSLLSSSFEQAFSGQFYWQVSDVVTLVCTVVVVFGFVSSRLEKRKRIK